ncbi:MAG: glycosyltransferase family 39 protein [Bacteroidota bacterium]
MEKSKSQSPVVTFGSFLPGIVQHPRTGLALAAAYALVLLYAALTFHVVGDYGIETDFFWSYVPSARQFLQGTIEIENFHGPAYPVVLGMISYLFGDFFRAGVVLSILAASCTLFLSYSLFRKLTSPASAVLGTLLIAVNPVFVQYSYSAGTDMMFFALVAGSAYFLFRNSPQRYADIAFSAVFAGIAYLTRYNGVFVVVAVPAVLFLVNPDQASLKRRAIAAGLFLGTFFLTILPWGMYCLLERGSFFYNKNYLNIAYEMYAKGTMTWDQYWYKASETYTSLAGVLFSDPGRFLTTVAGNIGDHGLGDMGVLVGWQVGIFTLAGIGVAFKERISREGAGFLVYSLVFFSVLLLVFYSERFSLFLLTGYTFLALIAFSWSKLQTLRFGRNLTLGGILVVVVIAWTFLRSYEFNRVNIDSGPKEILTIADWFKRTVPSDPEAIVLTRKPHAAYYLNMKMGGFPYVDTYEELLQEARKANARYLYFGIMEAAMRPQFQSLLDPRNARPGLRPLVYTNAPPAVLYEITPLDTTGKGE